MKTILKTLFFLLGLSIFTACNNDDNSLSNYHVDIATVINSNNNSAFTFELDNNSIMKPIYTNVANYVPKNGQRIVANYTILSESLSGKKFDVKLNDVYNVLTKGIYAITPSKQDSIGNDSIQIEDMWIGSTYLNVDFIYPGNDKTHFISLVSDASKLYNDGKIHLEFRHNANKDAGVILKEGLVSFDIKSLLPVSPANTISAPVTLVIHVNVPNQAAEKTYEFKFPDLKYYSPNLTIKQKGVVY